MNTLSATFYFSLAKACIRHLTLISVIGLLFLAMGWPGSASYAADATSSTPAKNSSPDNSSQNSSTAPDQPGLTDVSGTGAGSNATGNGAAATCSTPTGQPCAAGGGNPINVMTGNKYQREEDLAALPGKLGIEIVRHYNSLHMGLGHIGYGWRLSYEIDLFANPRSIHISQADGSQIIFNRSMFNPGDCACQDLALGHVMIYHTALGDEYTWYQTDGQQLHFNHLGKLERITAATGESVHLTRGLKGELLKVTDPQGRSLVMHYADKNSLGFKGIIAIDTPVGRFAYQHNNDIKSPGISNLTEVSYPATAAATAFSKHYHYGETAYVDAHMVAAQNQRPYIPHAAHLLTGISYQWPDASGKTTTTRQRTWQYDQYGRGILSVHGTPGSKTATQQVQLSYRVAPIKPTGHLQHTRQPSPTQPYPRITHNGQIGQTVITNSAGQTTTYNYTLIAGQYRLLQILGAGCSECATPNITYGYDKLGRQTDITQVGLTGKQNRQGKPIYQALSTMHTDFDQSGRVSQISRIAHRNGQSQAPQLQVRYSYANIPVFPQLKQARRAAQEPIQIFNQPSLIAKPSVIAGKEHQWHIIYNQAGQPLAVTETGYSPVVPVANNAADNKITTKSNPSPAQISRTTHYTYATINGRSLLAQTDGPLANGNTNTPQDSDITQYQYDKLGQYLIKVIAPGQLTTQLSYDLEGMPDASNEGLGGTGRVIDIISSDGDQTQLSYQWRGQLATYAHFYRGRQTRGQRIFKYDGMGNLIESGTVSIGQKNYRAEQLNLFDKTQHLILQANALGTLKQYEYDSEGQLKNHYMQSAPDESQRDDTQAIANRLHESGKAQVGKKTLSRFKAAFITLRDDFGRVVYTQTPHSKLQKYYNAVSQLIEQVDTEGNRQQFAYNLRGQRVSQFIISKDGIVNKTSWHYQANHLIQVQHDQQTEHYTYNQLGQLSQRVVSFKLQSQQLIKHASEYRYNQEGALASETLPDGSWVHYQRNGLGQVISLAQQTSPWTLFEWGQQTIAKDITRDTVGLTHLTFGNGVQGEWQRSRQGVLARVLYTQPQVAKDQLAAYSLPSMASLIMSQAIAQPSANTAASKLTPNLPGALGLPKQANALFDARLIYHAAGDVLLQQQFGQGIQQTQAYAYDHQHQLIAAQSNTDQHAKVWRYHYDQRGNRDLAQDHVPAGEMGHTIKASYHHDTDTTLNTTYPAAIEKSLDHHFVWNALGQLVSVQQQGQPLAQYSYNADGLRFKKQLGKQSVSYTLYNMQRQRVADLNAQGHITRQYVWLGDQLIATLDATTTKAPQGPATGFLTALQQTSQTVWHGLNHTQDLLAYVHTNHLHAPVVVTNNQAKIIWQADYAPYGALINTASTRAKNHAQPYHLALRNAGQWQDDETGLYYNDFRYYNPHTGRYVSPDPLGLLAVVMGSTNPYSYVNNNPQSYIDPWGLILFAFDGTGNTNDPAQLTALGNGISNVWNFTNLYNDGNRRYISGVGTIDYSDPARPIDPADYVPAIVQLLPGATVVEKDMAFNYSGRARIERMQEYFNAEADLQTDDSKAMDVDIIGFSRGAAQARDFANQVMSHTTQDSLGNYWYAYKDPQNKAQCQKVNFRFMGLWDSVLSTDAPLGTYNLQIPDAFNYVAQAIALNEHRGDVFRTLPGSTGAFPLESIMGGSIPTNQTRIEKGFIGAHADIGGGFVEGQNQLAQVALAWVYEQAKLAGVQMRENQNTNIFSNPVIHDKSDNQYARDTVAKPSDSDEDRTVTYRDGSTVKQKDMSTAGMRWLDTQNFITYNPGGAATVTPASNGGSITTYAAKPADASVGTVDMASYLAWLKGQGYTLGDLQVQ